MGVQGGMGHMGNGAHRGKGVQGVWGIGNRDTGGNGVQGVWGIWAMRLTGGMGYRGMGHMGNGGDRAYGNGAHGQLAPFCL